MGRKFTFLVFQEMASGSPVDLQREERWPSEKRKEQSTDPAAALEVKFNSDDEISDGEKFLF